VWSSPFNHELKTWFNILIDKLEVEFRNIEIMESDRWVDRLSAEDLAFLKRFLLASGTLKDLAAEYGISYPTVRLRLDRLIEKVKLLDEAAPTGRFETQLISLFAEGVIDEKSFRTLVEAHRADLEREARAGRG